MADETKVIIDITKPENSNDTTTETYLREIKELLRERITASSKPEGKSGKDPLDAQKDDTKETSSGGLFSDLLKAARKSFFGPFDKILTGLTKSLSLSIKGIEKSTQNVNKSIEQSTKKAEKQAEKIANIQENATTKTVSEINKAFEKVDTGALDEEIDKSSVLGKIYEQTKEQLEELERQRAQLRADNPDMDNVGDINDDMKDASKNAEKLGNALDESLEPNKVKDRFSIISKAGQIAAVTVAASLVNVGKIGYKSISEIGKAYANFVKSAANRLLESSKMMISSNSLFIDKEIADLMQRTGQTASQAQGTQRALDRLGLSMEDIQSGKLTAAQAAAFEEIRNKEIKKLEELKEAGTQAFDSIQNGQMMYMQLQQDIQDKITLALAKAGPAIEQVINVLSDSIDDLMPIIDSMMPSVTQLISLLPQIIEPIIPSVMLLAEMIAEIMPFIVEIVETVLIPLGEILSNILPPLIELVQMLLPHLVSIFNVLMPVVIRLSEVIGLLLEALSPVIDILLNILMPFFVTFAEILNFVLLVLSPIIEAFKFFAEGIRSIQKAIVDFLSAIGLGFLFGDKKEIDGPALGSTSPNISTSNTTTHNISNYNYGQIQTTGNSNMSLRQSNGVMLNLTVI